ncbi:alpha/beta fold hydrolase [Nonomuraea sp. CA-141351]|uniref:alpha/beta fold hydrolase n=1 Tax=Nonomuraea sp. CA-141351 TaxID=3239996 RepID=UPI003D8D0888
MPFVTTRGTTVPYTATGTGPGLVLLHGTSGDAATHWSHLSGRFTDRRRVIVPDYAGSGESTVEDGELTLDLLVEQAVAVIGDAADAPVDLVGFSMGAVVAAATTAAHPESVRRLVLIAGWVNSDDCRFRLAFDTWARLEAIDPDLYVRVPTLLAFSPPFLSRLGDDGLAGLLAGKPAAATLRQIRLDMRTDITAALPRIAAPTLVIGCNRDFLVPVEHSRALRDGIAGSTYAELDSGHVVVHEQPDELVRLIRDFLL